MSRDEGFAIADVSTSLLDDPKVKAVVRRLRDQAAVSRAVTLYLATVLGSWQVGDRLTVTEAAPVWLEPDPELIDALTSAGLLDADGRIPGHVWQSWHGAASERRRKTRDRWNRWNDRHKGGTTQRLPNADQRSTNALPSVPPVPPVPPDPSEPAVPVPSEPSTSASEARSDPLNGSNGSGDNHSINGTGTGNGSDGGHWLEAWHALGFKQPPTGPQLEVLRPILEEHGSVEVATWIRSYPQGRRVPKSHAVVAHVLERVKPRPGSRPERPAEFVELGARLKAMARPP